MPTPLRRTALTVTAAVLAVLTLMVLGTGVASAHVTVAAPEAAAGGVGEITFTVPTESATASTVSVSVQLPTKTPLATVAIKPVPGWTAATKTTHLAKPVTTDDGDNISDVISVITWTAAAGHGIAPGQYQTFSISAGPLPKVSSLTFPTVQTYSDRSTVAWVEPTIAGQPEPQHPAPALRLSASADQPTGSAPAASTPGATTPAGQGASGVQVTALILAIVALLAALAALALALATRRGRTPTAI